MMALNVNKLFRCRFILRNKFPPQFAFSSSDFKYISSGTRRFCAEAPFLTEIQFAHKVLQQNPKYSEIVFIPLQKDKVGQGFDDLLSSVNWNDCDVSELICEFEKLSKISYVPISHPSCANLRAALQKRCVDMTDEHLEVVLKNLSLWPLCESARLPEYHMLWNELDSICEFRRKKWKIDKVFRFVELWFHLHLVRQSRFVFLSVTKFSHNPKKLSQEQVVLLLFYLSLLRTATKNTRMFELECKLAEIADELTIDELAVTVMGFFKGDKCLYNEKLLHSIINKLIQEIKTVESMSFTAIIKELRKSLPKTMWDRAEELADAITPEVDRLSLYACVHAALFTTKPQLLHPPLLQKVTQKLVDNISEARLKDMEKTVFALTQMVFDPEYEPCVFKTILEELEKPNRMQEIEAYPKSFVALIHYFCVRGIFPEKWIKKILDKEFIIKTYGCNKFCFGRELLFMDCCVELECPNYSGPKLEPDIREYLSRRYSEFLPCPTRKLSAHQKLQLGVIEASELLFGKESLCLKYLLPHHSRADIVVHLDGSKKPLPLSAELADKEETFGKFLRSPGDNYYVILTASQTMCLHKSSLLNGESHCKLRQIKLLGYKPVVVRYDKWVTGGLLETAQYLKNCISSIE